MKRKIYLALYVSQIVIWTFGLVLIIVLYDGWFWIGHSISYLGTQSQTQTLFTFFLSVLALLGCVYGVGGIFELHAAGKRSLSKKVLLVINELMVVTAHVFLLLAALVPVHLNQRLHTDLATMYIVLLPLAMFFSSFIVPSKYSMFAPFTRLLSVLTLGGTYVLYSLVWSVVPAEVFFVVMLGSWGAVLYRYVLARVE